VYTCQYNTGHMFTDLHRLIEHEAECEFRNSQKTRFDNSDPNVAKNRQPMSVYCKYEVSHVFSTIAECQEHMLECPNREEFNKKMEQCHRKFTQNKAWIKAAQQAKREKEEKLGGNTNAPASQQMPNLRYQYMMNEPFIGGIRDTVQSSHEANIHKKRVAYELDLEEQRREENMTVE
jgi:pyruvate/2-oxoglutarate dehydrogenase complex dihydrolipoamide dehydrogenase (E3) component